MLRPLLIPTINLALALLLAAPALARQPAGSGEAPACATLASFSGDVQIFDSTRTTLRDAVPGASVRCGDWISVRDGRALLRHREGGELGVSDDTFVQVLDPSGDANPEHDRFTLYRGMVSLAATGSELRVSSANARARLGNGRAVLIYTESTQETQLLGLVGPATLENRFLPEKRISIRPGQSTVAAFDEKRLVPQAPRVANMQSFAQSLDRLGVAADVRKKVLAQIKILEKGKMPEKLVQPGRKYPEPGMIAESRAPRGNGGESASNSRRPAAVADERPAAVEERHPAAVASEAPSAHEHPVAFRKSVKVRTPRARRPASETPSDPATAEKQRLLRKLGELIPEDSE